MSPPPRPQIRQCPSALPHPRAHLPAPPASRPAILWNMLRRTTNRQPCSPPRPTARTGAKRQPNSEPQNTSTTGTDRGAGLLPPVGAQGDQCPLSDSDNRAASPLRQTPPDSGRQSDSGTSATPEQAWTRAFSRRSVLRGDQSSLFKSGNRADPPFPPTQGDSRTADAGTSARPEQTGASGFSRRSVLRGDQCSQSDFCDRTGQGGRMGKGVAGS